MSRKEELEAQIAELQEKIEWIKEELEWIEEDEFPYNSEYCYFDFKDCIVHTDWDDNEFDIQAKAYGNCFRTKKEAEAYREFMVGCSLFWGERQAGKLHINIDDWKHLDIIATIQQRGKRKILEVEG